jgi:hypothetical protein
LRRGEFLEVWLEGFEGQAHAWGRVDAVLKADKGQGQEGQSRVLER